MTALESLPDQAPALSRIGDEAMELDLHAPDLSDLTRLDEPFEYVELSSLGIDLEECYLLVPNDRCDVHDWHLKGLHATHPAR